MKFPDTELIEVYRRERDTAREERDNALKQLARLQEQKAVTHFSAQIEKLTTQLQRAKAERDHQSKIVKRLREKRRR